MAQRLDAKTLMEIQTQFPCWKYLTLWNWAYTFGEKAQEYETAFPPVYGEKLSFLVHYCEVYDSINSLKPDPKQLICDAVDTKMREDAEKMRDLLASIRRDEVKL